MSEENVDLVRHIYEVFNSVGRMGPDFVDPEEVAPDIWAQLAPDFEMRSRPDVPDQAVFRGREESKEFFRLLQEVFVELIWQPREFTDLGHAVVVETRINFVGRGSDVRIEEDETHVFWFRDGLISRLQPFPMREQALEAAQEPA
jgi:ketosteroid isomerase-like protein